MSREIKFRAWDKVNKKWLKSHYNHLFHIPIETNHYSLRMIEWDDVSNEGYCYNEYVNEQIELMQFTGLRDKNGVEIYEGDIMKLNDSDIVYVVDYQDNAFVLSSDRVDFKSKGYFTEREVIGNIYENKDLLK